MNREELIEAARYGNGEAVSALLCACQPDLRRYARQRCAPADVDDAVQDALLVVHNQVNAIRHAAALSSWLFRVIQRICDRMRYRYRYLTPLEDKFPASQRISQNLRLDLERALAELELQQLEVLLLRDMYGYSAQEVAVHLNISAQAVKSRLHRARMNIRLYFDRASTL